MKDNYIVEILGLNYKTGNHYILKDINWQIKKGEKWVLFGLNGCGKTTLLSIISGFRGGYAGRVNVFGEQYQKENVLFLRKKIAFVSSSFFGKIFANESIISIVISGSGGTLGWANTISDAQRNKARHLLKEFNLSGREDYAYNLLSKGERQNVLLARAMMSEADMLILDEPCSGLDVNSRNDFLNYLRDLTQDKEKTIIYVTHYADEILAEFTNTVLMHNGKIFKKGLSRDILNSENFSAFLQQNVELSWEKGSMKLEYC